jgi:pyruvate/2-oxoglutarate dehydrogenase complex dihydrolipoamide dehydrogenase (E3) component
MSRYFPFRQGKITPKGALDEKRYQLAVIGSGGKEAALSAARNGLRVGLIEKDALGGTCVDSGCYSVRALRGCENDLQ